MRAGNKRADSLRHLVYNKSPYEGHCNRLQARSTLTPRLCRLVKVSDRPQTLSRVRFSESFRLWQFRVNQIGEGWSPQPKPLSYEIRPHLERFASLGICPRDDHSQASPRSGPGQLLPAFFARLCDREPA